MVSSVTTFAHKYRKFLFLVVFSIFLGVFAALPTTKASAAAQNPQPAAKVSFTFDDGYQSFLTEAAPALQTYGYSGTAYMTTSFVGQPNFLTWSQTSQLRDQYGWEIGSHSVTHPLMTNLTATQLEKEVANSKKALQNRGFNPTSFATPYGDYNEKVVAAIAKHYTNHRPFHDTGYNTWPYNNYLLRVQQVQRGVSVETVKSYIDEANRSNTWLILVFHDIKDVPSEDPQDYEYATDDLASIAGYVKSQGIAVSNVSDGLVTAPTEDNLVTNPVQGTTLGNGWTTDAPANVTVNTANNGSAPEPKTSVRVNVAAPNAKTVHVFSPTVQINPASNYVIQGYVNITILNGGEVGVYVDEYDANGNWISGQYKQTIGQMYVKDLSFAYSASSFEVAKARLQVIVISKSGMRVFIDNVRWYVAISGGVQPDPTPQPIPATNLVVNGEFTSGFSGWRTDKPAVITHDVAGNGSAVEPQNSVKITSISDANSHLFSDPMLVDASKSYTLQAYLSIVQLGTSDVSFYVDEYDASGAWISGKYLYTKHTVGAEQISLAYQPSSSSVAKVSLQLIAVSGSGLTAYVDNVRFFAV